MKITIIHGQSHKSSTYHIARMVAEKTGGDITEFFLPNDFNQFCCGCANCFTTSEKDCPHYQQLSPITKAIDEADVLILASPVYVFHATGAMKALLDHYGWRWMVHSPEGSMFTKQAVVISTAAGSGMKSTNKDMADSLWFWGVPKIYKYGKAVQETCWDNVKPKISNVKNINVGYPNSLPTNCKFDSKTKTLEVNFDAEYGGRIFEFTK